MKKHSFLVVTELFLPTKGGTAVWFDEVYRRLGDSRTHIVTKKVPDSGTHDDSHINTIHRLALEDSKFLRPAAAPRYIKLFLCTLWLAITRRFSAIHAGRVLPEGFIALFAARLTFHDCVIYAHGEEVTTWSRSPRRLRAMRFAYQHADRVISNSEFTRQQLLKIGVPDWKITIIFPGVDVERYSPTGRHLDLLDSLNIDSSCKIILSVGRLSRRKGFDQTIRSIAEVKNSIDKNLKYVLIGIGEDRQYLEALARELGLEDSVVFLGHVSAEDLPKWYSSCDLFIMPNREIDGDTEGFGMVFVEAGACGKPVIAGDAGGTGDAVLDGVTGYRVDGRDVNEIARKIRLLMENEALSAQMGQAGCSRVNSELSWEAVSAKTLDMTTEMKRSEL